ncbi:hypothetical protein [Cytobacillus gottheilii]|uniref:hypothetical protein n=1 Tax=Cytobacillus gottheilii TaxID=859144 RepID=UPI0009B9B425|nr:hypothetical protein [Cytobacillus gottheilii]
MMVYEWKTFVTDREEYTQTSFEALIGDVFECMMFTEDDHIPSYIWTVNYVIIVKRSSKIFTDITFDKVPRNPVSA